MRLIHHQKTIGGTDGSVPAKIVYRVVKACTGLPPDDTKDVTSWLPMVTCPDCQADWVEHVLTP